MKNIADIIINGEDLNAFLNIGNKLQITPPMAIIQYIIEQ